MSGVFQNIVYDKNANNPEFYNTAWTLGVIRGVILWLVTLFLAVPVAPTSIKCRSFL